MKRAQCVIGRACSRIAPRSGAWIIGLAVTWMMLAPHAAWAQWNGTNPVWTNSNVGIGTTNLAGTLEAQGGNGSYIVSSSVSTANSGYNWAGVKLRGNLGGSPTDWNIIGGSLYGGNASQFMINSGSNNRFYIDSLGNVGIGTTNPHQLLSVNGTIEAKEVVVTTAVADWSDYVFQPGYRLRPLTEVADYIRANRHLPDIPSEAEVKEKGVSVGDMQAKLLAKIEELTLHMIQAERENRDLRERLARVEAQIKP